ncbi:Hsp70 family protein [Actinoplanes teichomyceticus]|uniref:Hsp70 protein n=1 Tax=Actinoplanes teichomyceticus TaxID=1867 RepID=A0A561WNU3_ACTTI|nr:Hsp70 family protein [Actinoplanes teichomyceticus]TWG25503.1 Hsp70 protein [Actinoplanes teichomyceticus]GIF10573.1 hypothetical protein Ate01nite_06050 [Actinoplanes teichomyceticus]
MSTDQGGAKYALGIDFGTSNTVAVARWPDGRARPILVDGSPLLPSAVFADAGANLLVGRDAVHSARLDPARFEPNPKRRVDDGLVLLGEQEFAVVDLITAVLARVVEEWHRAVGPYRPEATLTCPATWGATRRTLLAEAAARAGLSGARLVAEPVAAATYFAEVLGRDVPIGSVLMVHDFGAGTFDTSLVSRTTTGFEVLAVDGRDDLGGLDVDAALVEYLRTDAWQRLLEPSTVEERRARRQLWDDVRIAKERLSRAQSADFVVPLLDTEVHLTREELEQVARPVLEQTVRITRNLLTFAELPAGRLAGVFLVGGASRIPLMATLLHRELGEPPVVIEQPELVVAEGSILAGAALLASEPAAPGPTSELRLPSRDLPEFAAPARAASTPDAPVAADPMPAATQPVGVRSMPAATQPVAARSIPEAAGEGATLPVPDAAGEGAPVPDAAGEGAAPPVPEAAGEGATPPVPDAAGDRAGGARPDLGPGARDPEPPAGDAVVSPLPARTPGVAAGLPARTPGVAAGLPARVPGTAAGLPTRRAGAAEQAPHATGSGEPEPDVDNRETEIRPELVVPPHLRPPVDPWPDADPPHWRPDPEATVATSPPQHEVRTPLPPQPTAVRARQAGKPAGKRAAEPVVAHARPVSPVAAQARPISPSPGRPQPPGTAAGRAVVAAPRPPAKRPKARQKTPKQVAPPRPKRKSRLLRFFQLLLSLLTMLCVPVVALIVAYGYGNSDPWQEDAVKVFEDIAALLNL